MPCAAGRYTSPCGGTALEVWDLASGQSVPPSGAVVPQIDLGVAEEKVVVFGGRACDMRGDLRRFDATAHGAADVACAAQPEECVGLLAGGLREVVTDAIELREIVAVDLDEKVRPHIRDSQRAGEREMGCIGVQFRALEGHHSVVEREVGGAADGHRILRIGERLRILRQRRRTLAAAL